MSKSKIKEVKTEKEVFDRYFSSLEYINSKINLPVKYNTTSINKDLLIIADGNKIEFIKIKLFEILLTLSSTNRSNLIFQENDKHSETLRKLWGESTKTFAKHMDSFVINEYI